MCLGRVDVGAFHVVGIYMQFNLINVSKYGGFNTSRSTCIHKLIKVHYV